MPLGISEKCRQIAPSATLAVDAKAKELRAAGVNGLSGQAMTVEEMAEELCRLKSRI